ncbi:Sulfite efflux pump SSU1 [Cyphellophora attinorum]|uniref:Sulfite efflux pump SSU1 n=1 Tax=Cyphellophora attinorum TaxID=1664694 RepID=A0A0N0NLS2_9EURO|nr:Sulfite efflux pump SSU1 [Phialophora attinorum]KPI39631.1 Sulfite efflux pump SSU1 [Phialophora attinorum]
MRDLEAAADLSDATAHHVELAHVKDAAQQHTLSIRQCLRYFSPQWFTVTMGSGITSLLLYEFPYQARWLYWLSVAVFALHLGLCLLFATLTIIRFVLWPDLFGATLKHPVESNFAGAFVVSLLGAANMVALVCASAWGSWAADLGWAVWIVASVMAGLVAIGVPWMHVESCVRRYSASYSDAGASMDSVREHPMKAIEGMTAVHLLAPISTIVAGATAATAASAVAEPERVAATITVGYVLLGLGLTIALIMMIVLLFRTIMYGLPSHDLIMTGFITVGPPNMGAAAFVLLGESARQVNVGWLGDGQTVRMIGVLVALLLWGFGLLCLWFAVGGVVYHVRIPLEMRRPPVTMWNSSTICAGNNIPAIKVTPAARIQFNLSWWSLVFPLGTFALSTSHLAAALPSAFFRVFGALLSALVAVLFVVLLALTTWDLLINDNLELSTVRHSLTDCPEYHAVSYVWGTARASVHVSCNRNPLSITPTAYEMLQHLCRGMNVVRRLPLWIDAICINQDDPDEKKLAVPLMHQVFSQARDVFIWLGPAIPQTEAFMHKFGSVFELAEEHDFAKAVEDDEGWPSDNDHFWAGLFHILNHDWFRRLWTFQEVILARKSITVCGTSWVDLDNLVNVKEAVDRVWAISGLFNEDLQKQLAPLVDYSASGRKDYWRTHVRFMQTLLVETQSLGMLCIPPTIETKAPAMPSWCPNLSGKPACYMYLDALWDRAVSPRLAANLPGMDSDDDACSRRRRDIKYHPRKHITTDDKGGLHVRGFVVETISEVVEDERLFGATKYMDDLGWEAYSLDNPTHIAALEWYSRGLRLARRVLHGSDEGAAGIPREYLMAFFVNHRLRDEAELAYRDALTVVQTGDLDHILSLRETSRYELARRCMTQRKAMCGHAFFSTKGGRFGIAHPGVKPGDQVCVFYGAEPLHILRRPAPQQTDNANAAHDSTAAAAQFIGSAFIPHLMEQQLSDTARLGPDEIFLMR